MTNTEKRLEFDEKLHAIATDCWANISVSLQKHGAKFKGDGIGTAYGGWVALNQILIPRVSFLLSESIQQALAEDRERVRGIVNEKVKEYHKDCLTDMFINGKFWAYKEMQENLDKPDKE